MFDHAHAFTAQWEGGLVDHPSDPGGITNHGVSLRWLKSLGHDVDGDGDIDAEDIRALTKAQAKALFKKEFWNKLACDSMPQAVATVLYDSAVNQGVPRAVVQLQRAINGMLPALHIHARLEEDGQPGPKTRAAVEDLADLGRARSLAHAMLDEREAFYRRLAGSRPELAVFLPGWLNRVKALTHYLN